MIWPKVEHKLPELFELIIENDHLRQELKTSTVIPFQQFKDLKSVRTAFRTGAEHFIIRQKGGTPK